MSDGRRDIKILTLWQPWATLLACGIKRVETRNWYTSHRGPVVIHAAKRWVDDLKQLAADPRFAGPLREAKALTGWDHAMPLGAAIGVANLVDVKGTNATAKGRWVDRLSEQERSFGDYGPYRYGWFFEGFAWFDTPVPVAGSQGLKIAPASLLPHVEAVIARAGKAVAS